MLKKITSPNNPIIKHLVKLRENKSYRYEEGFVVVSGLKLIRDLSEKLFFRKVLLEEGFTPSFHYKTDETYQVSRAVLKKVSGVMTVEPMVAEVAMPFKQDFPMGKFLLVLDGISDPGNLGTLLRSSLGLGFDSAFLTDRCVDPYNEKAIRSAKGATFTLPWKFCSSEELSYMLKNSSYSVYAADPRGKNIINQPFKPPLALILGNESHGISIEFKQIAQSISIPMNSSMESLNVATAGAILMFTMRYAHE